jgi:hypothetical protein
LDVHLTLLAGWWWSPLGYANCMSDTNDIYAPPLHGDFTNGNFSGYSHVAYCRVAFILVHSGRREAKTRGH